MDDGPNIDLIVPRSEEIPDFYQAAEQMGFHALWFTETLFSQAQAIQRRTSPGWTFLGPGDGVSALAAASAATSRIRLGTAMFGNSDSILSFAEETANLDIVSHGRLSVGLSQHRWPEEGISEGRRPRIGVRFNETITLLKRLWSEDEVSFKGAVNTIWKRPPSMSGLSKKGVSRSLSPGLPARRLTWPPPWPMAGSTLPGVFPTAPREVAITSGNAPPEPGGTRTPWSWARSSIFPSTTVGSVLRPGPVSVSHRFCSRSMAATTSTIGALLANRPSAPPSFRASWTPGSRR